MSTIKANCPPLTPEEVFSLRGEPVAKRVQLTLRSSVPTKEEWIYYRSNTKESYLFERGQLVEWTTESI